MNWAFLQKGEENYLIINKQVTISDTFGGSKGFSEEELQDISSISGVEEVGGFLSNNFRVNISSPNLGFRTEAFFESVPDNFLDVEYPGWNDVSLGDEVPVILSSDYLALYNFGFAPSQGLPKMTPWAIKKVKLSLNIQGNGSYGTYACRIIGFSKRINSIVVPEPFLKEANKKFGEGKVKAPSRLIMKVNDRAGLLKFAKENELETDSAGGFGKDMSSLVNRIIWAIGFLGLLSGLVSCLLFFLVTRIEIEEKTPVIQTLFLRGFSLKEASVPYQGRILKSIILASVLAFSGVFLSQFIIKGILANLEFDLPLFPHWISFLVAVVLCMVLILIFKQAIKKILLGKYP